MLEKLKRPTPRGSYFLQNRWDNPLHAAGPTEQQGCLWPSSEDFYHPLNAMFSCFFTDVKHLAAYDEVLLRDGVQTLLDFYLRFPTPKGTKSNFYVSADLYFLVPEAWRPQTKAYRLQSTRPHKMQKSLLFYGLVSETFLTWSRVKRTFPQWLKRFDPNADVCGYFTIRNEPLNHKWEDRTTSFELMSLLQHHFKKPIDIMAHTDFIKQGVRADMTYVNLDRFYNGVGLCSVDNTFMGQAIDIFPRGHYAAFSGKEIGKWPMSFNHQLALYEGGCPHEDFTQFFFMRKMNAYPYTPKLIDLVAERLTADAPA